MKIISMVPSTCVAFIVLSSAVVATPIVGNIDFGLGTVTLLKSNNTAVKGNESFIANATKLDFGGTARVNVSDGSFAGLNGTLVTFNQDPWSFSPLSTGSLWSVGGFTFSVSSVIVDGNANFLELSGFGKITAPGFHETPGTWSFSTQKTSTTPATRTLFSWSSTAAATRVPDGGNSVALLCLSLLGLYGARKKLSRI